MSGKAHRANVDFVFADEDGQFRLGLSNALAREGYASIRDCRSIAQVVDAFRAGTPDLLLLDARMEGSKAFDVIADIRRGTLGQNPFVTIMVTLWQPDGELVERVIQSGVDDLLLKPISTTQLIERISKLASERQRFVVTTDYIGPQRRKTRTKDDTEEGLKLDLIDVPNTLGAKSRGEEVDNYELQRMVARAQVEINEQRLMRNAPAIAALVRDIVPAYRDNRVDAAVRAKMAGLSELAADVSARLLGTGFVHVADLCAELSSISATLQRGTANAKSVALLTPLSNAISVSFNPQEKSAAFADQVIALVRAHIEKIATETAPSA